MKLGPLVVESTSTGNRYKTSLAVALRFVPWSTSLAGFPFKKFSNRSPYYRDGRGDHLSCDLNRWPTRLSPRNPTVEG